MDLIMIEINLRFLLGKKMIVKLGLSHDKLLDQNQTDLYPYPPV